jgi:hypothetical protein
VGNIELIETVTLHGCCRPVPLDHLVRLLIGSATDAATDRRPKFTDDERKQLLRQGSILSGAVAELMDVLTDHPLERVREHRLATLFEALGSTTFVASHVVKSRTLGRLRIAAAVGTRSAGAKEAKRIIAEEMTQHGCAGPIDKRTAGRIGDTVRDRTGQDLEDGTIQRYARALRETD